MIKLKEGDYVRISKRTKYCPNYFTRGKKYKVIAPRNYEKPYSIFFSARNDDNQLCCLIYKKCGHLSGGDWVRI